MHVTIGTSSDNDALHRIDNYAKDGRPGEVWLLCSFYHEPLRT